MADGILGVGGAGAAGPVRRAGLRRRDGALAFCPPDEASCVAADTAAGPAGGVAAVGATSLLAMQEQAADAAADASVRRHASSLLDGLAQLQHRLLAGDVADPAALQRLARLCDAAPQADGAGDPALRGIAGAIGLRVRIELARSQY